MSDTCLCYMLNVFMLHIFYRQSHSALQLSLTRQTSIFFLIFFFLDSISVRSFFGSNQPHAYFTLLVLPVGKVLHVDPNTDNSLGF